MVSNTTKKHDSTNAFSPSRGSIGFRRAEAENMR
jgi:hypothetical protein